jgi:hypothetical protein
VSSRGRRLALVCAAVGLVATASCRRQASPARHRGAMTASPGTLRTLVFREASGFRDLKSVSYRIFMEGPCCILDVPPDFQDEVAETVRKNLIEPLPGVKFTRNSVATRDWQVEIDVELATQEARRMQDWPCRVGVILARDLEVTPEGEAKAVEVLHWSERTMYDSPGKVLEELERQLAGLVEKWKKAAEQRSPAEAGGARPAFRTGRE